ncbi:MULTISPECIES: hypothetical protein [Phyllobacteriaceae]|jgi:hypothetical protein|uniref:hypothetical protein n=1 Tax=Phyllobacteriaceae TaxID=69277 RepID=UPI00183148DE|nr:MULTISPECIES: hypothetical protein [Mesorhizobium]MDQ0328179.1 hypothetical protein [Mesorhizobium sp. YL-MeA3-2017]
MQVILRFVPAVALLGGFVISTSSAFADCPMPSAIINGQPVDATPVNNNFSAVSNCIVKNSPAGSANSVQVRDSSGGFGGTNTLSDGQLLIGSTGALPMNSTLTAGTGINIQSSPSGIIIAAPSGGNETAVDWLNSAAVVRPSVAAFSLRTSTTPPSGAGITATVRGFAMTATGGAANTAMMAETPAPSGKWQATMLTAYTGAASNSSVPAIAVRDSVNNRAVEFGIGALGQNDYRFSYLRSSGGSGLDRLLGTAATFQDIGLPAPSEPLWTRLTYDGTTLSWAFSRDGQFFVTAYSAAADDYLVNVDRVGPAILFSEPVYPTWPVSQQVLSWTLVSLN